MLLTLIAFGSNSILCRFALAGGLADAAGFTAVRLGSGALCLSLLALASRRRIPWNAGGSWISGALLFGYAAAFSYAYLMLSAGTGGLILFGSVQFTMIGMGLWKGERPSAMEWAGIAVAHLGFLLLIAPGLHAPPLFGALLMALAGVCWGFYSLRGKSASDPALATGENFLRSLPFAGALLLVAFLQVQISATGAALAVLSGAVTSGLGYVLWYSVLPRLSSTQAAVSQLAVPAMVAIAGTALLSEPFDVRLAGSTLLVLGGVAVALYAKRRPAK